MSNNKKVLFVSIDNIKDETPIQMNVDDDRIRPFIIQAQEVNVQRILGTKLFNRIRDDIMFNTLRGDYRDLLNDYIKPVVVQYTLYYALPFISMQITNKSIGRGSADWFNESSLEDLKYLRNASKDYAEYYEQRLIQYLACGGEGYNKFIELKENKGSDIKPTNRNGFFSGIYVPKK